jgi:hypothetical protein
MINPSSQPSVAEMYAELRLISGRVRWLRRACLGIAIATVIASMGVWVVPNGSSWGL